MKSGAQLTPQSHCCVPPHPASAKAAPMIKYLISSPRLFDTQLNIAPSQLQPLALLICLSRARIDRAYGCQDWSLLLGKRPFLRCGLSWRQWRSACSMGGGRRSGSSDGPLRHPLQDVRSAMRVPRRALLRRSQSKVILRRRTRQGGV